MIPKLPAIVFKATWEWSQGGVTEASGTKYKPRVTRRAEGRRAMQVQAPHPRKGAQLQPKETSGPWSFVYPG